MSERTTGGLMTDTELEAYVGAVTARLGAIPDRDETVEELRAHLEEVRAEHTGVALRDVLGEPAAYADELRAAAGLPPYSPERQGFSAWLASCGAGVRRHAPRFLLDLRAFWWGVRGLALGLLVFALIPAVRVGLDQNDITGIVSYYLSPDYVFSLVAWNLGYAFGTTMLVLFMIAGVAVSVWIGGVQARGAGPRWLATFVGILGVLLGVWFVDVLWILFTSGVSYRLDEMLRPDAGFMPPRAPF